MANTVSELIKIKRRVYTFLVRLAMKDKLVERLEKIPDLLCTSDTPRYRCCEYKERAVVAERIKLALGFDPVEHENTSLTELAERVTEEVEENHVVNILNIACDRCPIDKFMVTDACRNCVAHSCVIACPKNAIVMIDNRAFIDQRKCIECGKCKEACAFGAIHENSRPCVRSCAVNAIQSDSNRQAAIDYEKCIGCGKCIIGCPFGAIADQGHIVQVVKMLTNPERKVNAILAPSFVGQFGAKVAPETIKAALREIGFDQVYEAALGADMVAMSEAHELVEKLEEGQEFMTSSCCPAFLTLLEKHYAEIVDHASTTVSPMIALARSLKKSSPEEKVVFIGPCIAKKVEAQAEPSVDAVLTFEELGSIFVGMGINLAEYEAKEEIKDASTNGRNFAYAGGLRSVMQQVLESEGKGDLLKATNVDGVDRCLEILNQAVDGKLDSNFIEGMGCAGGCVGGPGIVMNSKVTTRLVQNFAKGSQWNLATENEKAGVLKGSLVERMER